jgi:Xaa-Pro dipeptidase
MPETWTPKWSNAVFSNEERDSRWSKVRALMARDGIDVIACLPWTSNHDRGQADSRYLTQLGENSDETSVIFPIEGDVTAWHSRGGVWPSSSWITDLRAAGRGTGGQTIIDRLKEMGFERGTLGIAGLTGGVLSHCRSNEGEVNWQSVDMIQRTFPNAKIVSATDLLGESRFVKSEEEIEFLRKGTEIADALIEVVAQHARAGVPEREVWAHMMYTYGEMGGSYEPMFGWISGPLGNTFHRVEQPTFRKFAEGDVLSVEFDGRWGGYISQVDQLFTFGKAPQDVQDVMKLTIESYNRVEEAMKPGVTVGELMDIGNVEGMGGRGLARLGMHGRGTGDDGPLVIPNPIPGTRELVMQEGAVMCVKPSGSLDGKSDYGRWGECVVVRANGGERLGKHPQKVYEQL